MIRQRAGLFLALCAFGCGARTGLLSDSDPSLSPALPDGDAGATSAAGAHSARGGASANGGAGAPNVAGAVNSAGAAGSPPQPVSTHCQLTGDDPRVAGIKPDEVASLDGANFVSGDVASYHWTLQTEDCDAVVSNAQFTLQGVDSRVVQFQPSRPAFYHFTLQVTGVGGDQTSCKLEVPVQGVGMRVELCWDTSTSTDLDLYLHTPFNRDPWFALGSSNVEQGLDNDTCNTSNATVLLRLPTRLNWGYPDSPLSACNTPSFQGFVGISRCPNPRAADDNNQSIATGTTERMQLDNPGNGQRFRVMVQNFSNTPAHPHVYVYCGGEKAGDFDAPAAPANFVSNGPGGLSDFGLMWRSADVTTLVDASGKVSCSTAPVTDRPAISINDPTF